MMIATRKAGEMMGGVIEDLVALRDDTATVTAIHTGDVTAP
jgi:hypothetical protein